MGFAVLTGGTLANAANTETIQQYQTELRPNESLKQSLLRLQIKDGDVYKAIEQPTLTSELATLPVNTPIKLKVDSLGKVQTLKIPLVQKQLTDGSVVSGTNHEVPVLVFVRPSDQPSKLKPIRLNEKTQVRIVSKSAPFDGNFFNVMDRQEIPDTVSEQFVRMFSGSVNFARDLRHQATFTMKYEVIYLDNHPISTGKVLYGGLNTSVKNYQAYWWQGKTEAAGNY
jgi:hypothetical protein